jgi:hypothetical protein
LFHTDSQNVGAQKSVAFAPPHQHTGSTSTPIDPINIPARLPRRSTSSTYRLDFHADRPHQHTGLTFTSIDHINTPA